MRGPLWRQPIVGGFYVYSHVERVDEPREGLASRPPSSHFGLDSRGDLRPRRRARSLFRSTRRTFARRCPGEQGLNSLIDLDADGKKFLVMAREIQRHPVRGTVSHIDFQVIDPTKPVIAEVPLHLVGDAVEVRHADWEVDQQMFSLEVRPVPTRSLPTSTWTSRNSRSASRSASRTSSCPRASSPPATRAHGRDARPVVPLSPPRRRPSTEPVAE